MAHKPIHEALLWGLSVGATAGASAVVLVIPKPKPVVTIERKVKVEVSRPVAFRVDGKMCVVSTGSDGRLQWLCDYGVHLSDGDPE